LGDVQIASERAVVGVIGDAAELENGGIADVLKEMVGADISVRCAGLGALGSTVSVAVAAERLTETVRLLHSRFFPG
jgi:aspartokinase